MHAFLLDLWRETGMTIFMVSHDLTEAFKLATRVLVFDKLRWDPQFPDAFGATITYDLKLDRKTRETRDAISYGPPAARAQSVCDVAVCDVAVCDVALPDADLPDRTASPPPGSL